MDKKIKIMNKYIFKQKKKIIRMKGLFVEIFYTYCVVEIK